MPSRIVIHGALFLVAAIYGANYSITKFALPEFIQPFGFVVLRILGGGIFFWLLHYFSSGEQVERKDLVNLALCGLFGIAINQMAFLYGLSLTSPINASVLMTATPLMVFIIAFCLGREQLSIIKITGLFLGAFGAYLLITNDGATFQSDAFVGDLFIIINAVSYAIYLVMVKTMMKKYTAITVIKWVFLFGGIIAVPFGIEEFMAVQWSDLPGKVIFALIYVVIGTTVVAYLLNAWSLVHVESSVVGVYIYLQPVLAIIMAGLLKEDFIEPEEVLYSIMIMLGVYLVSKRVKIKLYRYEMDGCDKICHQGKSCS